MSDVQPPATAPRTLSGRWMVVGMFLFGSVATGLLYAYWTLHLMPFMPLQAAIVQEFPGSAPRVDGGKKRMSQNTPTILRIVMKSQIDPLSEKPESVEEITFIRSRIAKLAVEKVQLPDLAIIELHIYKLLQEKEIRERSWRLELESGGDWYEVDQRGERIPGDPHLDSQVNSDSLRRDSPPTDAVRGEFQSSEAIQ